MKKLALMITVLLSWLYVPLVSANTAETEVHYAGVVNGVADVKYMTVDFNLTDTGYEYLSRDRQIQATPEFIPVLEATKDTETVVPNAVFVALTYNNDDVTVILCDHASASEMTPQSVMHQDVRYFVQAIYDESQSEGFKLQCKYSYL